MTDDRHTTPTPFRVGSWYVQPLRNLLSGPDGEVRVTKKSMELLCLLADAEGEVLTRERIMDAVWGDAVVNEEALTRVVSDLRRALGDDRYDPRFIETITKRGYRLVAAVERMPGQDGGATSGPGADAGSSARPVVGLVGPRFRRLAPGVLVLVAASFVVLAVGSRLFDRVEVRFPPDLDIHVLTSDPGLDAFPALDADGTTVAFARRASETDRYQIFVKQPGQVREIQLTNGDAGAAHPAWSPDGSTVAFIRYREASCELCTVPALGGPVRVVAELPGRIVGLDWSPDGRTFAVGHSLRGDIHAIVTLDAEGGEPRAVTRPIPGTRGDVQPVFSGGGEHLAFVRHLVSGRQAVCVVPVAGGEARVLSRDLNAVGDLDWYLGDRSLLVSGTMNARYRLWHFDAETGVRTPVPLAVDQVLGVAVCPANGRLVIQVPQVEVGLVRIATAETDADGTLVTRPFAPSTATDHLPALDAAGARVAFVSTRTGAPQVFVVPVTDGEALLVSSYEDVEIAGLAWEPTGGRLLVHGLDADGRTILDLIDPDTGRMDHVPWDDAEASWPAWSADGSWIYVNRNAGDGWRWLRIRPDGSGSEVLRPGYTKFVHEEPDGGGRFFVAYGEPGLRERDASGIERIVGPFPAASRFRGAGVIDGVIHYLDTVAKRSVLVALDTATGATDTLGSLVVPCGGPVAVLPGGGSVLATARSWRGSDLAVVALPAPR